ncbi:short-chain fatty acid transporter [Crocinitomix algicola]|uniref:short-chain fatty acid transporter n=1 Tax=Crocinitomix algicola TaxID=1740263 RepID=UPI00082F51A3|nr:TIGR00366 family protein [Crocinitomix algicola]
MAFTERFINTYKKLIPSPFTIALLLTFITVIIALIFTKPNKISTGAYFMEIAGYWEKGLWNKSDGGIYFAFQMMFMLVFGHIIALSTPVYNLINKLLKPCTNTANTVFIVTFSTILVSYLNWGLGLIFGAILARQIGEKFNREKRPLNYSMIGAAAYVGLMVWHGGLSGSAPIKAAESGNLKNLVENVNGIDLTQIPERLDLSETLFSNLNIFITISLLICLPGIMYLIGKRTKPTSNLPSKIISPPSDNATHTGLEKLDQIQFFNKLIGALFIGYAIYKAFILPDEINLKFINPNFINFCLFGGAILLHDNIKQFTEAAGEAIKDATGILLQFPLYFGILGIMIHTGLINLITDSFVAIASESTLPLFNFISAALVNIFVPSGGGQWVVQGPILVSAAQELGVGYGKSIMAMAYGEQLTNMIQPFWALPLLGITGLKAKEILPYTMILFGAGLFIFTFGLLLF